MTENMHFAEVLRLKDHETDLKVVIITDDTDTPPRPFVSIQDHRTDKSVMMDLADFERMVSAVRAAL